MRLSSPTFLTGMVVGGLLGAAVGTMYAPAPGPAISRIRSRRSARAQQQIVDDQSDQSFPASDPPSWTTVTTTNAS